MNARTSLDYISSQELPGLYFFEEYARKRSQPRLSIPILGPAFKEYQEVGPNTYIRSKPMVFPETLKNMSMKEFFGSRDLQKLEAMKSQLDTTVGALLQKKQTINAKNYLGPVLLAKQIDNHQSRLILKSKSKQRAKLQEKEEKKFIKKIQKKREKEAITHSENISRIRNERLDRFRIIIGKHEHAMIESLVQTRSQSPKEIPQSHTSSGVTSTTSACYSFKANYSQLEESRFL